jgi:hypothetical protein
MRFRLTLFWNDLKKDKTGGVESGNDDSEWIMKGRQRACRHDLNDEAVKETVDVPPVSILNSVSFETMGETEVAMLDFETRLMRYVQYDTCVSASL